MQRVFTFFALLLIAHGTALAQLEKTQWVDSVMNTLTVDEKIGQLFLRVLPSNATPDQVNKVHDDIKAMDLGGVVLQHETPHHQVAVVKMLRSVAKVPLLVGQDGDWGVSPIVDSTMNLPEPLLLGAIAQDSLIVSLGRESARQMKLLGINLSFASLSKVTANFQDPLFSYASFGIDKTIASRKVSAFIRGMADNGVLACAKPYGVTGLTITEYVGDIPRVRASVDTVATHPFHALFENNLAGVMPASLPVPIAFDNKVKQKKLSFDASTLSQLCTGWWLKQQHGFQGLVIVDLQRVKLADEKAKDGDDALIAFQAGNDMMMNTSDIGGAIRKIKKLVKTEDRFEAQLNASVRRILQAKYDAGLAHQQVLNPDNLIARLHAPAGKALTERLYERAVTVLKNDRKVIPIVHLDNKRIAYLSCDLTPPNDSFSKDLSRYAQVSSFALEEKTDLVKLADMLARHHTVIIGVFPQSKEAILTRLDRLMGLIKPDIEVVFCDFGNENFLRTAGKYRTVLTAYMNSREALVASSEVLFGAISASGKLPFTASRDFVVGTGINTPNIRRLRYASAEQARMDSRILSGIDAVAQEAILTGATPGMQVIVARGGTVVYEKNFGTLNHNKNNPVTSETIYDLASLTKVSATLQAVMFMYEKGLIDINRKVSFYLPELKNTNKKDITILETLTHQAGLAPFIPMWTETVKDTTFLPLYYSRTRSAQYPLQVSPNLYGSMVLRDSVWSWILASKLIEKQARTPYQYRYSDLSFLILQRLAETLLNQPLDEFVTQNFYEPLGAYTAGFLPLDRFPKQQIAPTEYDRIFRRTLVSGTVHDERGALMGGVAGHAGLFGTASDLVKLGQMLLQDGYYGGYRYYKPETVRLFTHKQFDKSRRGLGWDKPLQSDWTSPTSLKASPRTFGHTGFTGTCIWVDPEFDLVYVFLSNRVYPDRSGKLISANIRSRIQDVIYDAIFEYCEENPVVPQPVSGELVSSLR